MILETIHEADLINKGLAVIQSSNYKDIMTSTEVDELNDILMKASAAIINRRDRDANSE